VTAGQLPVQERISPCRQFSVFYGPERNYAIAPVRQQETPSLRFVDGRSRPELDFNAWCFKGDTYGAQRFLERYRIKLNAVLIDKEDDVVQRNWRVRPQDPDEHPARDKKSFALDSLGQQNSHDHRRC
jgi:hypothetical protein